MGWIKAVAERAADYESVAAKRRGVSREQLVLREFSGHGGTVLLSDTFADDEKSCRQLDLSRCTVAKLYPREREVAKCP